MFQLIKHNHEVIIWGPPVVVLANLAIQLELIVREFDISSMSKETHYIIGRRHFLIL